MLVKSGILSLALCLLLQMAMLMNVNTEKLKDDGIQRKKSYSMEEINQVYVNYNDLNKVGLDIPIYFGSSFPSKIPNFLPKEEADLLPFSSQDLPFIVRVFGFSPGSPQAQAMDYTLKTCETKMHREAKKCVTSLESMLDFIHQTFYNSNDNSNSNNNSGGKNNDRSPKVLSTSPLPKSTPLLQNYTILKQPQQVPSPKMVTCHIMTYPYAVFHCHYPEVENRVFEVSLRGSDGASVDAIVACHMNTSTFDPNHISFKILKFKPGDFPVCHFLPSDDLLWVPDTQNQRIGEF